MAAILHQKSASKKANSINGAAMMQKSDLARTEAFGASRGKTDS
jgi:hypothetical protein